jgi:RNA recognition motif-containing protein
MSLKEQLHQVRSMIAFLEAREAELLAWGAQPKPASVSDASKGQVTNAKRELATQSKTKEKKRKLDHNEEEGRHAPQQKKQKQEHQEIGGEPMLVEKPENRVLVQGLNYEASFQDVKDFFLSVGKLLITLYFVFCFAFFIFPFFSLDR